MAKPGTRKARYAKLRVAHGWAQATQPGWDEDCYRDLLGRNGADLKNGKFSATTMNLQQLDSAIREFEQMGFLQKRASDWRAPRIRKLFAIWNKLADAEVVQNRSFDALEAWCRNQVDNLGALNSASGKQLNTLVESIKQWATNQGLEVY